MTQNPFNTKFVADVGTLVVSSSDSVDAEMTVGGVTVLSERYSPANGEIVVRGLRNVLEAAIYGELKAGPQENASKLTEIIVGSVGFEQQLFASRLRNPRDPYGRKTVMAAGDLVAVASGHDGDFVGDANVLLTQVQGSSSVYTTALGYGPGTMASGRYALADGLTLWIDFTSCPERAVAVRFLNRYDVPQTMMTTRPLEVKPGFQDQTAMMYGRQTRYSVSQQDEYTLRSGAIHSMLEYASWADLITSRKAEVWMEGQWLPVIITKTNFNLVRRSKGMNPVEVSFRMADPRQGL